MRTLVLYPVAEMRMSSVAPRPSEGNCLRRLSCVTPDFLKLRRGQEPVHFAVTRENRFSPVSSSTSNVLRLPLTSHDAASPPATSGAGGALKRATSPVPASVTHRRLSGPRMIPRGTAPAGRSYSVMNPSGVARPIRFPTASVNHIASSGPRTMLNGLPPGVMPAANSVTLPLLVIRPIRSPSSSVNHRSPPRPGAMSSGPLAFETAKPVPTPAVVIRTIRSARGSVSQRAPTGGGEAELLAAGRQPVLEDRPHARRGEPPDRGGAEQRHPERAVGSGHDLARLAAGRQRHGEEADGALTRDARDPAGVAQRRPHRAVRPAGDRVRAAGHRHDLQQLPALGDARDEVARLVRGHPDLAVRPVGDVARRVGREPRDLLELQLRRGVSRLRKDDRGHDRGEGDLERACRAPCTHGSMEHSW